jgi:hypothetical protein
METVQIYAKAEAYPDYQRFLEADGLIFFVDRPRIHNRWDSASIGQPVNLWIPEVKNPDNDYIYLRSPGPPIGLVPYKYIDIIASHLADSMDYDARVVEFTDNTIKIKCRLFSREDTKRMNEDYKSSLIKELKKPYNPKKSIILMIATKKKKAVKVGEKLIIEFEDLGSYGLLACPWQIKFLNQAGDTIDIFAQDRNIIHKLLKSNFNSFHLDVEVVDIAKTSERMWNKLTHNFWKGYPIQLVITPHKNQIMNRNPTGD